MTNEQKAEQVVALLKKAVVIRSTLHELEEKVYSYIDFIERRFGHGASPWLFGEVLCPHPADPEAYEVINVDAIPIPATIKKTLTNRIDAMYNSGKTSLGPRFWPC